MTGQRLLMNIYKYLKIKHLKRNRKDFEKYFDRGLVKLKKVVFLQPHF